MIPYSGELEDQEKDIFHRDILFKKIKSNTWALNILRSMAHLSCELAFKAILYHKSTRPSKMKFKHTHNLQDLFFEFDIKTQKSFTLQYEEWPEKKDLGLTLFDSGLKFITQRYGDEDDYDDLDIFYLCKFIHEDFNLENI